MSSAERRWNELLTRLQLHLDELSQRVAGDDVIGLQTLAIPSDLPPLPSACADLASDVARQHAEVVRQITDRLAARPARTVRPMRDASRTRGVERASRYEARA